VDVLTGVGGRRSRPESAGQRGTRGSAELQQGGARRHRRAVARLAFGGRV
jgi:hypothetical protein